MKNKNKNFLSSKRKRSLTKRKGSALYFSKIKKRLHLTKRKGSALYFSKIKKRLSFSSKRKGSALYFTVLTLSLVVGISFTLNSILISQINIARRAGDSVLAFYAADTGIERVLNNRDDPRKSDPSDTLENGASYEITFNDSNDPNCDASNYCIISRGTYNETTRAIRITY